MAKSETKAREENATLRCENRRLKAELETLRSELAQIKGEIDLKADGSLHSCLHTI